MVKEDSEGSSQDRREKALLSWIQQYSPYGVFTLDASLRVQSWNRWMESHSELASKEALGLPLFELFPELVTRKLTDPFQRALAGESSVLSTALHRHLLAFESPHNAIKDDPMRQTARIAPLIAQDGVCGVVVVIEDVTQRETQAASLVQQHRRDEALSWALVNLLKSDEPRKTVRQLFFKVAGQLDFDTFFLYLRSSETGEIELDSSGGVSEELQPRFLDYKTLSGVVNANVPVVFNQLKISPGEDFALLREAKITSAIAIPLRAHNRRLGVLCFASASRDIIAPEESDLLSTIAQYLATALDKENTNRELRRIEGSNQWMSSMVESSDDAIISKDLNGIIKSCNRGAARLFGYESNELIGKPMQVLIPNDHQDEEVQILQRIRSADRIENFETIRQRKDGRLVEVSLTVSPVIDLSGVIIGASNIARDISERRQGEQKLAASFEREKIAREKAEVANRAKDDFLASLSHELRTPLNPILLIASDASENPNLAPEVKADFDTIRKNVELEARLIDDLLDLTRITHGKLSLHLQVIDLKMLLQEAVSNIQSEISEKLLHFSLDYRSDRRHLYGDDVRLRQVLWNVLKNAIKFTPPGGKITVLITTVRDEFEIGVSDTGIGIDSAEIGRIFEAFSQGKHVGDGGHRFGGLGLGLAIARKLVEMHGGTIAVTSEGLGRGATFTIRIPSIEPPVAKPALFPSIPEPTVLAPQTAICILLVEDHEATRRSLAQLLVRRGFKVIPAATASEARLAAETEKLDLVISDVGLPDGDGHELMKHLNARYRLKGIAMTGYGMEEDVAKSLASGFVTHLIKPVNIRSLETTLASVLNR